jgi:uncharacterized protein (DUF2252 family)
VGVEGELMDTDPDSRDAESPGEPVNEAPELDAPPDEPGASKAAAADTPPDDGDASGAPEPAVATAVAAIEAAAATVSHQGAEADPNPPHVKRRKPEGVNASERRAWGQSLRTEVPRSSHAEWAPAADRPDPVALLEEQGARRVPDLVPIRYGRMLASPFTFLRGAALVMAADFARLPSSGLFVQSCGDAHLSNFGIFMSPERRLLFDINDFDETYPAPFEWDVRRLATSVVVASRDNRLSEREGRTAARNAVRAYRNQMLAMADMPFLDVWYTRTEVKNIYRRARRTGNKGRRVAALMSKASTRNHLGALAKYAELENGKWHIREEPPLIVHLPRSRVARKVLNQALKDYAASLPKEYAPLLEHYVFADGARKVVGVGSVGTEAFMLLFLGDRDYDPLFLQLKEASESVLERYTEPGVHDHQGERVVVGQRLMQAASDPFLGWFRGTGPRGLDFYVRQLLDGKASVEVAELDGLALARYAGICGGTLARAHARSGSSSAIAGYLGRTDAFDRAIENFAVQYADQTEQDHTALAAAEASGRIVAERGV